MNAREPEPDEAEHPDVRDSGFDFSALNRSDGWAAPRPVHPDGTPAAGAFDPRSWWPRYQHRFAAAVGRAETRPARTDATAPTDELAPTDARVSGQRA
ncbi:MAG: hypothetical protein M3Z25_12500, partial [Actinomycetota bacterium]|nr:hypothetical protein [Actinomycetota bacterium]